MKLRLWMMDYRAQLLAASIVSLMLTQFLIITANYLLLHHDLWWHLASGDWIRENHKLPVYDFWSYTAGNQRFYLLSWLWDICASWLYQQIGLSGLVIFYIWLITISFAAFSLFCAKVSGSYVISIIMAIFGLVMAFTYSLPDPPISVSPQTFTICLSIVWLMLNQHLIQSAKPLGLFASSLLIYLLWVNCHGGFLIAFTISGSFWLQAVFNRQRDKIIWFTVLGVCCLGITLINPLGIDIVKAVASTALHPSKAYISEWQSYAFSEHWLVSIYILFSLIVIVFSSKNSLALKILSIFWLIEGIEEQRNLALYFIFSLPLICITLSKVVHKLSRTENHLANFIPRYSVLFLSIPVVAFAYSWQANYPSGIKIPDVVYPVEETAYLQSHFPPQKIYNHWNFGGYLIFATRGNYPIYIDGRAGTAYPDWLFAFDRKSNNELVKAEALYNLYGVKIAMTRLYPPAKCSQEICRKWHKIYSGKIAELWQRGS